MPEAMRLTAAMARIQRLVARGFVYHASGVIPLEKAERVVAKLSARYGVAASEAEERARLRKGQARVRLTLWPEPEGLAFVLQATEGSGVVHEQECLLDARRPKERIVVRHYELAKLPRRKDCPRWTWRLPLEVHRAHLAHAAALARRAHPGALQDFIDAQLMRPQFNGVRTQTRQLLAVVLRVAKDAGHGAPQVPEVIPWIRANYRADSEPLAKWIPREKLRRTMRGVRGDADPGSDDASGERTYTVVAPGNCPTRVG